MSIRVLIADDNPEVRASLSQLLSNTPDMQVVGLATNGLQTVHLAKSLTPNVIVMDALLPHMEAIETIREIMDLIPVPIVVVSSIAASRDPNIAVEVIKAGALVVLQKPIVFNSPNYNSDIRELVASIRAMSGVHVIRHPRPRHLNTLPVGTLPASAPNNNLEIVSIVASTGGPQTLSEILKNLPINFALPIIIVQHITPDFVVPLVRWLNTLSPIPVRIATSNESPVPGTIYFAPGSVHLRLTSNHQFALSNTPTNLAHTPSGDILLESVAQHYSSRAMGIILTGMGRDGAQGLRAMYDAGAMTVAQEGDSCVVFGMPQEAILLGAARQILTPSAIADLLGQYVT